MCSIGAPFPAASDVQLLPLPLTMTSACLLACLLLAHTPSLSRSVSHTILAHASRTILRTRIFAHASSHTLLRTRFFAHAPLVRLAAHTTHSLCCSRSTPKSARSSATTTLPPPDPPPCTASPPSPGLPAPPPRPPAQEASMPAVRPPPITNNTVTGGAAEVDAGTGRCLPGGGCRIARCRASYARRGGGGSWKMRPN